MKHNITCPRHPGPLFQDAPEEVDDDGSVEDCVPIQAQSSSHEDWNFETSGRLSDDWRSEPL